MLNDISIYLIENASASMSSYSFMAYQPFTMDYYYSIAPPNSFDGGATAIICPDPEQAKCVDRMDV